MTLNHFLYPKTRYYGSVHPENLVFNANLQEFAHRIGYIANLETAGKMTPQDAYQQMNELWECLENSYYQLGVNEQ